MSESKPRLFQDSRDILMSLLVIVVVMGIAVSFTGLCSFNKDDKEFSPVQKVDAAQILSLEARSLPFPVRFPETPEGWTTINARRTMINSTPAVVVGYLTDTKGYVQVMQTDQPEDAVAKDFGDTPRDKDGQMNIDGVDFSHYPPAEKNDDDLWIGHIDGATLAVSGVADTAALMEMAGRYTAATPLPGRDTP
ncbi:DUF4245 domain-containing protein [Corynebacterium aquilae]|uniref:DUF4245 domain-containing protein n=1 Tax=Corynebacterium aquilae TaxID=203263 RepID=UPI00095151B6|nr:DUF4245 domain-containing protein [Corynebacterium aquilae]